MFSRTVSSFMRNVCATSLRIHVFLAWLNSGWADWNSVEDIDPKITPAFSVYLAGKSITEKIMWRAAEECPHIDFTCGRIPVIKCRSLVFSPLAHQSGLRLTNLSMHSAPCYNIRPANRRFSGGRESEGDERE